MLEVASEIVDPEAVEGRLGKDEGERPGFTLGRDAHRERSERGLNQI